MKELADKLMQLALWIEMLSRQEDGINDFQRDLIQLRVDTILGEVKSTLDVS